MVHHSSKKFTCFCKRTSRCLARHHIKSSFKFELMGILLVTCQKQVNTQTVVAFLVVLSIHKP